MSNQQFDININEGKYDYKKYFFEKLLPLILGSLIITGGLSVYNKKSELTKFTFQTEYKPLVTQGAQCSNLHQQYIESLVTYSGLSQVMNDKFGLERILKYGNSNEFKNGFIATIESWSESLKKHTKLRKQTIECYKVLDAGYSNLAVLLGISNSDLEAYDVKSDELIKLQNNLKSKREELKKVDVYGIFDGLIRLQSDSEMKKLFSKSNYQILSQHSLALAQLEENLANSAFESFNLKRNYFSEVLRSRFDRGVISSIPDMWF